MAKPQAEADKDTPAALAMEFYHQAVFYYLGETYGERLRIALHETPIDFRKVTLLPRLSPGQEYGGQKAWEICRGYLDAIEGEMARLLRRHSMFFWMHLYRRIGVWLSPDHGGKTDANTLGLVRQIVELTISKHGDLGRDDDVALSSEIRFKDILGGHYRKFWRRQIGSVAATEKFRALAETKQWVLTKFALNDYFTMYLIEGFAYEYWRVTALMRAIGKGSAFVCTDGDWPDRIEPVELSELIVSYDERIKNEPFSTALVGSWFHLQFEPRGRDSSILIPYYNVEQRSPFEAFEAFGVQLIEEYKFSSNFLVGAFDLEMFRSAHGFVADAFSNANGFSLDAFLLSLWALANVALLPARVIFAARDDHADLLDPKGPMFGNFVNLLQRAYTTFDNDLSSLVDEILFRAEAFSGLPFACTRADVESCLRQLMLCEKKRDQISLWSGGRRFPLIEFGRALLIDLQGIPLLLRSLFYRIQYEQTARGSVFEETFRAALTTEGFERSKDGEIVTNSGEMREIDASVRIGDQLARIIHGSA